MIRYEKASKSFDNGASFAVRDVTLSVADGETLVLLGASGCGKTTLLKMTNRLVEPSAGAIRIDGEDVSRIAPTSLRRRIGYVFQGVGLFPHMTVEENIAIIPKLLGWEKPQRTARARELLEMMDLDTASFAGRFPDELSGGQRQRVGVARALAGDPEYLLMDEPFGALDAVTRDSLQKELLRLKKRLTKTIIFVTHDIFEALALGDRIAVLNAGRLEQVGSKEELVKNPASEFVVELFAAPRAQLRAFRDLLELD